MCCGGKTTQLYDAHVRYSISLRALTGDSIGLLVAMFYRQREKLTTKISSQLVKAIGSLSNRLSHGYILCIWFRFLVFFFLSCLSYQFDTDAGRGSTTPTATTTTAKAQPGDTMSPLQWRMCRQSLREYRLRRSTRRRRRQWWRKLRHLVRVLCLLSFHQVRSSCSGWFRGLSLCAWVSMALSKWVVWPCFPEMCVCWVGSVGEREMCRLK